MRGFSAASHVVPTRRGQTGRVSTFLKVALGLLLTLPLGAYITGCTHDDVARLDVEVYVAETPQVVQRRGHLYGQRQVLLLGDGP